MQIKFRCQYCQQLLGISRSRAGAHVDCPGCGRSIRVPGTNAADNRNKADNQNKTEPPTADRDPSLDEALESLIRLSESSSKTRPQGSGAGSPVTDASARQAAVEVAKNSPLLIPDFDEAAVVIRELASEMPTPDAQFPSGAPIEDLPGTASRRSGRGVSWVVVAVLILFSFIVGGSAVEVWHRLTVSSSGDSVNSTGAASDREILELLRGEDSNSLPGVVTESGASGSGASGSGASGQTDRTDASSAVRRVTGTVRWVTDAEKTEPDSQALVLLIPSRKSPGLRFDGRSLREPEPTPDQKALRAGLREFGVTFVRAKSDGSFELDQALSHDAELVIVSRHRSRSEGVEIPATVAASLSQYFDSGLTFVGQLAVKTVPLPQPASVETADAGDVPNSSPQPVEILFERP